MWIECGGVSRLVDVIDFEIDCLQGKPTTAALGQQQGHVHANLDALDPHSSYTLIR